MTLDALIHCPEKHHLHDPTVKEREQWDRETQKEKEREGKGGRIRDGEWVERRKTAYLQCFVDVHLVTQISLPSPQKLFISLITDPKPYF